MDPTTAAIILDGFIFLTDQYWKLSEKLERIGAQDAEETKLRNAELTIQRHKLVEELTRVKEGTE